MIEIIKNTKIDFMGKAITVAGTEGAPVIEGW